MTLYPSQDSWVRGEVSPRLHARASLDLYRTGLAICENFLTLPHGGIRKRGGSYYAGEVIDSDYRSIGIPFIFSDDQAYMLELGQLKLRVYAYGVRVGSVELTTPWPASVLDAIKCAQSADDIWLVHPDYKTQKLIRTDHIEWTLSDAVFEDGPFMAPNTDETKEIYVSAATGTITVTADFAAFSAAAVGQLIRIDMEDYEDIAPWEPHQKVAAGDGPLGELCRYDGQVYECMTEDQGVDEHRTGATPPTHEKGTEKDGKGILEIVEGSNDYWSGLDWKYLHSGFGVAVITVYLTPQTVTALVLSDFPAEVVDIANKSDLWRRGALAANVGYADSIALFEERLTVGKRFSVYGSKTSDFESFKVGEKDDDALQFLQAGGGAANDIVWLTEANGFLVIGTIGGVRSLSGSGLDEALTPSSFKNRKSRTHGCAPIAPVDAGEGVLYIAKGRKALIELQLQSNGYFKSDDLGQISEHIPKKGIVNLAFQEYPDPFVWFPLDNGELGCFTYQPAQEVRGMHRHRMGGSFGSTPYGVVEYAVATPGQTGEHDVWLFVKRTIGNVTKRYIEVLTTPFEAKEIEDAFQVDCGLSYEGVATTSVTGATHLKGQTVNVLAGGTVYKGVVVSAAGGVSLPAGSSAATPWHVGLGFTASAETLELDAGSKDGSLMGRRKKASKAIISTFETDIRGLQIASKIKQRWETAKIQTVGPQPSLYSGNVDCQIDDSWEGQAKVIIRHSDPTPCTLRAMSLALENEP